MKKTFIYGLYSNVDGVIRYIGKSDNPAYRLKRHIYQVNDSKTHKNFWIKRLIKNGEELKYKILEEVLYEEWPEKEKNWISKFDNLLNTSIGGLGGGVIKYKMTYEECKKYVSENLSVKSKNEWLKCDIPNYIAKNPYEVYKNRGWISWGDFLGTNRVQDNKKVSYISYMDAKKWIIDSEKVFKNSKEYKNSNIPSFLPKRPERYYKDRGWVSWSDFLSNNRVQNQKKLFIDYNDCINWLIENHKEIKSHTHWKKIRKNFPNEIPTNPNIIYANKGWVSWKDFFNIINNGH